MTHQVPRTAPSKCSFFNIAVVNRISRLIPEFSFISFALIYFNENQLLEWPAYSLELNTKCAHLFALRNDHNSFLPSSVTFIKITMQVLSEAKCMSTFCHFYQLWLRMLHNFGVKIQCNAIGVLFLW